MAESSSIPPVPQARRKPIVLNANIGRVITRPYIPPTEERIRNIINRVLNLDEDQINKLLETVLHDFSHRHRYFR
jgi:2C-methyl-D-erythritol 2,4-cyclodiphosphate synthase